MFFNNRAPNFEQNRFSESVSYQFDKSWAAQAGYLDQNNINLGSGNDKENLMLILLYKTQRSKKSSQHAHSSPMD
ncbi:MAG: hypothetical protein EOP44_01415 [Sphingobacteriaceae bacterium]|nr:MAG: hypothetical protein EOP44_01415 [Sphingobacteriaceae bacterium]